MSKVVSRSPLTTLLEPVLPLPPTALARDDGARIYGEEFADWMTLTPAERWRESCRLWATFYALGGRLNDDSDDDADLPTWHPRPTSERPGSDELRRRGV